MKGIGYFEGRSLQRALSLHICVPAILGSGLKGPRSFLSKVPVHGLHRDVLVQCLFSKLATFRRNRPSVKAECRRVMEVEFHTYSALLLSSKRDICVQNIVLVYPNLERKNGNQSDHRLGSGYLDGSRKVATGSLTVPDSNADETRIHWFASAKRIRGAVRAYVHNVVETEHKTHLNVSQHQGHMMCCLPTQRPLPRC